MITLISMYRRLHILSDTYIFFIFTIYVGKYLPSVNKMIPLIKIPKLFRITLKHQIQERRVDTIPVMFNNNKLWQIKNKNLIFITLPTVVKCDAIYSSTILAACFYISNCLPIHPCCPSSHKRNTYYLFCEVKNFNLKDKSEKQIKFICFSLAFIIRD